MKKGTTDLRAKTEYWPLFAGCERLPVDVDRVPDKPCSARRVRQRAFVSGMGSIRISVVPHVPVIYEDGVTFAVRLDPIQQAVRHRLGQHKGGQSELMSRSTRARVNMASAYCGVVRVHGAGSVSRSTCCSPAGVEIMGHDRGSRNRYMVNVFDRRSAARALRVLRPRVFAG